MPSFVPPPTADPPTTTAPPRTTTPPQPAALQLPRGGRQIFPAYRVVAYYGGPDGPALGALGSADPDTIAARIAGTATQYAPFGRHIQPAMELIATVARPCGAAYPTCSGAIPHEAIQRYLDAAHRHKLLLILDFQPGRGEFLPQVRAVEPYLKDPSVSVALDPEWKLGPGEFPMQVIGSAPAASVNAVSLYLSALVRRNKLPDKLPGGAPVHPGDAPRSRQHRSQAGFADGVSRETVSAASRPRSRSTEGWRSQVRRSTPA